MGSKNLKAIVIIGDKVFDLPTGDSYGKLYQTVYRKMTATEIMHKYHDIGTPVNVASLNEVMSLPIRNLKQTTDPEMAGITGERFASDALLRNHACSGCPVGCIHVGYVRERFAKENRYSTSRFPMIMNRYLQLAPCWALQTAFLSLALSML
ncbi:MAG: Aldehyde ferredoxin oxidoreductase, domains 2 & 3 [Syntrophorhabdus sp. PtaB.Bin027]|nr:MAG: Aldehyde ferredoxin oxidoreductase, domains 2 & 3 [Syntrophorhabdus sp. PtaB.Bin027]